MDPQFSVTQTLQEISFMNVSKRVLTAAVAATLGASALPSQAMVPGVAGEALLLPMAVNNPLFPGAGNMNTYMIIRQPAVLGSDFVMNNYTTPNLRAGQTGSVTLDPASWTVYWTWYDPRSNSVVSGQCEGSPNDVIVWTTDADLLATQQFIDGQAPSGVPLTYCGDEFVPNIGYVVFETFSGADALTADFAMEANAYIVDDSIADNGNVGTFAAGPYTMAIPVFPMADGEDPNGASAATSPRLGLNEVVVDVSSDGGTRGDGQPRSPVVVSPLGSGVRMNDGNPGSRQQIDINASVQAPLFGQGYSMHVLWFDRNNSARASTQALLWDEHEQRRDWRPPIDKELNVLVYNMSYIDADDALTWESFDLESGFQNLQLTSLVDAVYYDVDYISQILPMPLAWNLSTWGYNTYLLEEEGDELGGPDGTPGVNAAMVVFEGQEINIDPGFDVWDAWTTSLGVTNGFR
jgi:hypothetical protein